jgi:DNA processing protein
MAAFSDRAALIALLATGRRPWSDYAELVESAGSALAVLEHERRHEPSATARSSAGGGRIESSPRLFEPEDDLQLDTAAAQIAGWQAQGIRVLTVLDAEYPDNLRAVFDRPPLIFVAGNLLAGDGRSVAVIGSRDATRRGTRTAAEIAERLVDAGYTVVSGLAAGIDTAAHRSALAFGGRTVGVIGTGLKRSYPPQNSALQRRIAEQCAVVSQFWPDAAPSRRSFPMRNALMSGLSLATVIVEASQTSGARAQARFALAHGRPVLLIEPLLEQPWARELSLRPGAHVVSAAAEVVATVQRLNRTGSLVG